MYRVELKAVQAILHKQQSKLFLMYRVELKVLIPYNHESLALQVPNVPCGVERMMIVLNTNGFEAVPNVPCGVERGDKKLRLDVVKWRS